MGISNEDRLLGAIHDQSNLEQSEEFQDNHDNDNYSSYVEDVSAHAGD
jgi:hypothetical protein